VLFTLDVPTSVKPFNSYEGSFEIDGGGESNASNFLASVNFQIEIVPASAVPEPSNLVLMLVGLAGVAALLRRKRGA
jgi:PEP-CTERM motif